MQGFEHAKKHFEQLLLLIFLYLSSIGKLGLKIRNLSLVLTQMLLMIFIITIKRLVFNVDLLMFSIFFLTILGCRGCQFLATSQSNSAFRDSWELTYVLLGRDPKGHSVSVLVICTT